MKHLKLFEESFTDLTKDIFGFMYGWLVLIQKGQEKFWVALYARDEEEAMQELCMHFSNGERFNSPTMDWEHLGKDIEYYAYDYGGPTMKMEILAVIDGLEPQSHDRAKADIIAEDRPDGEIREWMDERFENIRDRIGYIKYILRNN